MARKIITSARGKKLDFDTIKAAATHARPITNKVSSTQTPHKTPATPIDIVVPRSPKLNAESPAPRPVTPEQSDEAVEEIDIFSSKEKPRRTK